MIPCPNSIKVDGKEEYRVEKILNSKVGPDLLLLKWLAVAYVH